MHLTSRSRHQLNLFIHHALQTVPAMLLVAFTYLPIVITSKTNTSILTTINSSSNNNNNNGLASLLADPDPRLVQFEKSFNDFTRCTLDYPNSICNKCKNYFNILQDDYFALTKVQMNGLNDVPLDSSILKIAENYYSHVKYSIWTGIGHCDRKIFHFIYCIYRI